MRNETIYRKTAEDMLMLLLVTSVLGVASVMMADWPATDLNIQTSNPAQAKPDEMLEALNALFIKPFSVLIRNITPHLHLAALSLHL